MAQIDDFKANLLGGGARSNQYRVSINEPSGVVIGLDVRRTSFLCRASKTPAVELGEIELAYRGRKIYMTGDRETSAGEWTTTFYMDTDYMIRNALERWSNGINAHSTNTGLVSPINYEADLKIEQLDRNGDSLKEYVFRGAFPNEIAPIDVSYETVDAIEEFTVTFTYQYFEALGPIATTS
jgi:hypothetical protein